MKGFHNSISESGQTLLDFEAKAQSQQQTILEFMRTHSRQGFTAFDVWRALFSDTRVPVTSCRRVLSNLRDAGLIIKTDRKVLETYGKVNYVFIFNSNK